MTRREFLNKVIEIYFRDNCNVDTAIQTAIKELNLSKDDYIKIMYGISNKNGGKING
ncbi:hypothetical protein SAMN05443428_15310 [Caloramator quimbayensis]|uniref:Uncharacterized protein n=1 Tax=Caloramator quimbayensis TaxID=1147123 RepID=A0A1T4YGV2_9CLOT|nr:hypothetical protein [Caloramator quimbayensis]SKB01057.1 hypothetical protein SAMN05443428_15310 [Caloramator quimbayensis]